MFGDVLLLDEGIEGITRQVPVKLTVPPDVWICKRIEDGIIVYGTPVLVELNGIFLMPLQLSGDGAGGRFAGRHAQRLWPLARSRWRATRGRVGAYGHSFWR